MDRQLTNAFLGLAAGAAFLAVLVAGTFASSLASQSTRAIRTVVTARYSGTPSSFGIIVTAGPGAIAVVVGVALAVMLRLRRAQRGSIGEPA